MKYSERELKIIKGLLQNQNGFSIEELEELINASRRTVYREINELTQRLDNQIKLVNQAGKYHFVGTTDELMSIAEEVDRQLAVNVTWSIQQRQSALAVKLLIENEPQKMQAFAIDFNTSTGTISKDLLALENNFKDYQIQILRKKARGIEIEGNEYEIRNLLIAIMDNELNSYEFFRVIARNANGAKSKSITSSFMELLGIAEIQQSYSILRKMKKSYFKNLSDEQMQRLTIILTVLIRRIRSGNKIQQLPKFDHSRLIKNQRVALDIFLNLDAETKQLISSLEVNYLTLQMEGLINTVDTQNNFENYDLKLSYGVQDLINQVSEEFNWNFDQEPDLYNDIMLVFENPVVSDENLTLETAYSTNTEQLRKIVYEKMQTVTSKIEGFQVTQHQVKVIQFMFQNAFEAGLKRQPISVLVVCPNGIATAQILRNRLLNQIPEISKVSVARISTLDDLQFEGYDLILSTIELPGFEHEYKQVSPLLLESEIDQVKVRVHQLLISRTSRRAAVKQAKLQLTFQEFDQRVGVASQLLNDFQVKTVNNPTHEIGAILNKILVQVDPAIIDNIRQVQQELLARLAISPVGIPETGLALVHTTSDQVHRIYGSIYELKQPIKFPAMDGLAIELRRIVLLLGPKTMNQFENALVGRISTLIIENQATTNDFESGSTKMLQDLIGKEFIKIINEES